MEKIIDQTGLKQYKKKYNFFETPMAIAEKMADLLDGMGRDRLFLDPSIGRGVLARAVVSRCMFEPVIDFCEIQEDFYPLLTAFNMVGSDFAGYHPDPIYDAIIMNPPYKNKLAEKHVDHAWTCLKAGGRISALVSTGAADYLDNEYSGHIFHRETIKKGFEETTIDTVMMLIIKPLY